MAHLLYNIVMYLVWAIAFAIFTWNWRKHRLRNPNPLPLSIYCALAFTATFMSQLAPMIFQQSPQSGLHWVMMIYSGVVAAAFTGCLVYLLMHRKSPAGAAAGNHIE
ncbi:MAG: hypothetical protein ABIY70_13425 [Capsulimonas sp.]|uniref:hypothetical protein n=1 Tax=Capsulimonas sp. TaxID=2494211 RepID=UPI0032673FC1